MKTDICIQNFIRSNSWGTRIYLLDKFDNEKFDIMRQFELSGFDPIQLTPLGKIWLSNTYLGIKYKSSHKEQNQDFKRIVLEHIIKLFPNAYEIRFLSKGVYIR